MRQFDSVITYISTDIKSRSLTVLSLNAKIIPIISAACHATDAEKLKTFLCQHPLKEPFGISTPCFHNNYITNYNNYKNDFYYVFYVKPPPYMFP